MIKLRYCEICKDYTMDENCHRCNKKTIPKAPPRFSPQDHYGKYRRMLKKLNKGR